MRALQRPAALTLRYYDARASDAAPARVWGAKRERSVRTPTSPGNAPAPTFLKRNRYAKKTLTSAWHSVK
jgi:hypothetical protein